MELQSKASTYFQTSRPFSTDWDCSLPPVLQLPALGLAWHSELGLELKLLTFLLISACSDNYDFSSPFSDLKNSKTLFSNNSLLPFLSFRVPFPVLSLSSPSCHFHMDLSIGFSNEAFLQYCLVFRTQLTLARGIPARGPTQTLTRKWKTHPDFFPD